MDLEDFKTWTCRICLPCHFFFSCINAVYSLFYRMHIEEVNRLIQFFIILVKAKWSKDMLCLWQGDCCKEDMSKRQKQKRQRIGWRMRKKKERELQRRQQGRKRKRNEEAEIKKREEESEGLRLIGSQKDQYITEKINSSRGPGLEKFHQRPSWSLFIKCS